MYSVATLLYSRLQLHYLQCLRTLLKGDNVCVFVNHWLYLTAPLELIDGSGKQLYLVSKDAINSIANSFYISQRNPQLKGEHIVFHKNKGQ